MLNANIKSIIIIEIRKWNHIIYKDDSWWANNKDIVHHHLEVYCFGYFNDIELPNEAKNDSLKTEVLFKGHFNSLLFYTEWMLNIILFDPDIIS